MVEISNRVLSELAFGAFRYGLGRQSYWVEVCVECLEVVLPHISDNYRRVIVEEIEEAIEKGQAGHKMDVREWRKLLAKLKEESK